LVGGFRFDPLGRPAAIWKTFTDDADARLVLPRHMLAQRGGAAWLTTNVLLRPERLTTEPSQDRPLAADAGPPSGPAPLSPGAWKALTGSVARGIRHGQLGIEKVVLARTRHVQTSQPIDQVGALRQLAATYPSCTVFAFGHRGAC